LEKLDIIFHDHHLIAVNKPAGIPVGSEDSGDVTLLQLVRTWNENRQTDGKKGYCVPIHFLDRPVSGVVIFALSSKAAARLNSLFKSHKLTKTYIAVCEKTPTKPSDTLEHWLVKDRDSNISKVTNKGQGDAKFCKLDYQVLANHGSDCFVKVLPQTGRSHQIRVQLSQIGCPIIGDVKYGAKEGWISRIALHALELKLLHPVGDQPLVLRAEFSADWLRRFKNTQTFVSSLNHKE
jgi:23S rRNA pseudouridine1911/1915/1917 synthase